MFESGDAAPQPLDEVAWLDRTWFLAHPERRHRCRQPSKCEIDLCGGGYGSQLIIAVRHLGRGLVLYQPLLFCGAAPSDEEGAAALFALAAEHPDPIPKVVGPIRLHDLVLPKR
jgi:hypothetical protein